MESAGQVSVASGPGPHMLQAASLPRQAVQSNVLSPASTVPRWSLQDWCPPAVTQQSFTQYVAAGSSSPDKGDASVFSPV